MNETTKIRGYFNGARWPVQLVISKLNLTLTLPPGEFILDRVTKQKINDPYFEVFANNKQLQREVGPTDVPIFRIPVAAAGGPPSAQTNPVRAVSQWTRDARGIRQPVLTPPPPPPVPSNALPAAVAAMHNDSVRPMSMEDARRAGLVRKVREVPEDYGVSDTTGLPPSRIPNMRYSVDPSVGKPAPPLPKEMLSLPADDPSRQNRAQLVAGLARSESSNLLENATNPFANTVVLNGPPDCAVVGGASADLPEPLLESGPARYAGSEPEAVRPAPRPAAPPALPSPAPEFSDDAPGADLGGLPEPDLTELEPPAHYEPKLTPPPQAPPTLPLARKNQFVCLACNAPHKFRSQLLNHAKARHPQQVNAIMAVYPATEGATPA